MSAPSFSRLVLAGLYLSLLGCARYPTRDEVQQIIESTQQHTNQEHRSNEFARLLKRLSDPKSSDDDAVLDFSIAQLARTYRETRDVAILDAVDSTQLDGGFANSVCGFYVATWEDRAIVERYQQPGPAQDALRRCVGLSVLETDLQAILQGKTPVQAD